MTENFHRLNRFNTWIAWNLFLAFIPVLLSFYLFRRSIVARSTKQPAKPPLIWWLGLAVYIVFLPNAPYVLTDIIHFVKAASLSESIWLTILFYLPLHFSAIFIAFEAYVISLINQGIYLKWRGISQKNIFKIEILTHFLCAIGIYLGRFLRFNSWDVVIEPEDILMNTINDLTTKGPLFAIVFMTVILIFQYWIMKPLTLRFVLKDINFNIKK